MRLCQQRQQGQGPQSRGKRKEEEAEVASRNGHCSGWQKGQFSSHRRISSGYCLWATTHHVGSGTYLSTSSCQLIGSFSWLLHYLTSQGQTVYIYSEVNPTELNWTYSHSTEVFHVPVNASVCLVLAPVLLAVVPFSFGWCPSLTLSPFSQSVLPQPASCWLPKLSCPLLDFSLFWWYLSRHSFLCVSAPILTWKAE